MIRHCIIILTIALGCLNVAAQKTKTTNTARTTRTTSAGKSQNTKTKTAAKTPQKTLSKREKMQLEQKNLRQNIEKNKKMKAGLDLQVKNKMQEVTTLNHEIDVKKLTIDSIRVEVNGLNSQICKMDSELTVLQGELKKKQDTYAKSVRRMHRNNKTAKKMMFIFSAKNVNQMYQRTRFVNQYATYQKAQGEALILKKQQVAQKQAEVESRKKAKTTLLNKGVQEQQQMEDKQKKQQELVTELQKQQKTVQELIVKEQKQEASLNAQIERMIAEEIAREKARQEAERKRREAEQRRQEELARQQQLRKQEADKQRETAQKTAKSNKRNKATAKNSTSTTSSKRQKRSRENTPDNESNETRTTMAAFREPSPDARLSGSFASNKGRLPMPITGAYQVVRGFGANVVEGIGSGVHLPSKGIHLKGQPGAQARSVFEGEVSRIFATGNNYIVMIRHGKYISVYCNLASVSVSAGQKVSTGQTIGSLGNNTMQFQLRNWTSLLDPRQWLRR